MKIAYCKTAYCINNYHVCVIGRIMGILPGQILFEFGKDKLEWVRREKVFETKNEAIKDRICELKEEISEYEGVICSSKSDIEKQRAKKNLEYNKDAIDFLTSQLESVQEGF